MKRFSTWVLAFVLCTLSALAFAQPPGGGFRFGGGGGFGGGLGMLNMTEVQKELKMTPEQIEKVKTTGQEMGTAIRALFQEAGNPMELSEEDRTKLFAKMQDIQAKAVASVLKEDQMKRYRQLDLQQGGSQALSRKDVAEELKITDEQKGKLTALQTEQREAMGQIFRSGGNFQDMTEDERAAFRKKMGDMRKSFNDKAFAVLTADQTKKWKEMLGEPFKFPARGPGRPGGGAPPPPRNP